MARLKSIGSAKRTLALQYYSWAPDAVGYLLMSRLIAAADNGVAVRILVDDIKLRRSTRSVASLCLHPNIAIRVFNPWGLRSSATIQGLEFALNFKRLNRRMHNKLLVADGEQAIFGGRNVGDEYFGLSRGFNFVDFDALATGAVVSDLSDVFESYWASRASVSGGDFHEDVGDSDLEAARQLVATELERRLPTLSEVLAEEAAPPQPENGAVPIAPGTVRVVSDSVPDGQGLEPTQVVEALTAAAEVATTELLVVTPFFVPDEYDVDWYRRAVDRGVRVRLLTNSLASNPGTISNSGLKKQRAAIVEAGVELHELRTDASAKPEWETAPQTGRYLGLHAKLYIIDRKIVFVGSLNLDPRSITINTETGVLIHDRALAEETADMATRLMAPQNSWSVAVSSNGTVTWTSDRETRRRQPARHSRQRLTDLVLGLLPIRDHI